MAVDEGRWTVKGDGHDDEEDDICVSQGIKEGGKGERDKVAGVNQTILQLCCIKNDSTQQHHCCYWGNYSSAYIVKRRGGNNDNGGGGGETTTTSTEHQR